MKPICSTILLSTVLLLPGARIVAVPAAPKAAPKAVPQVAATTASPTKAAAPEAGAPSHPALADFPLNKAPYMAAYRWGAANPNGGARANEAYARWINRSVVWAEDFEANEAWENNIEGGGWQLGEWRDWKKQNSARRLILSIPLLPGGWDRSGAKRGADAGKPVSLDAGAKGDYNAHFKALAQNLIDYGLADSVLRLGWEFNGGWYTWRASDNPKAWAEYWKQIVTTMRSVKGAETLQFCWNPALGWQQFPSEQAYPGDEYVDIVGLDVYDDSWAGDTYPLPANATREEVSKRREKAWNDVIYGGQMGLKQWRDFALAHGKLFSIPEWGVSKREDTHGGLDNAAFIERIHEFINDPANNVYFHCYFDVQAGDGHHQLSPGLAEDETNEFPQAAARFRTFFMQSDVGIPGSGTGLSATYFGDQSWKKPVAPDLLPVVDFDWSVHPPEGAIKTASAARFTGQVQALESGVYTFQTPSNGQSRLWVNDQLVLDETKSNGTIELVAGQKYSIKQELVGGAGAMKLKLQWKRPGKTAFETVPQTQLFPQMGNGTGLYAEYFSGANFGKLITTRADPRVDFWWGRDSPGNTDGTPMKEVGPDDFSVRWTGQVQALESGAYTFKTNTDDGVRLWVDGKLLIDHWAGQALIPYDGATELQAGKKYAIKMQYFDGTGDAVVKLSWLRPGHATAQTVPQSQLYAAP